MAFPKNPRAREASRNRRADRLAMTPGAVHRTGETTFDVGRPDGERYAVDIAAPGGPSCSCLRFWTPSGQICTHVRAVRIFLEALRTPPSRASVIHIDDGSELRC